MTWLGLASLTFVLVFASEVFTPAKEQTDD